MKGRKRRRIRGTAPDSRPGSAPGTLSIDPAAPPPSMHLMAFGPTGLAERTTVRLEEIPQLRQTYPILWLNVDGLGDEKTIRTIGELFCMHRLVLEDIVNVHQRPKVEAYDDHLFIVTRMIEPKEPALSEQLSIVLGAGWVVTFQEQTGDCLDPLRERIRDGRGRARNCGSDYLAYAIIDAVVDDLFPSLDAVGDRLDDIESRILARPEQWQIAALYDLKHDLVMLRRVVWPQREALGVLLREENPLIHAETLMYLRDSLDHNLRALEIVETYRELAASLVDLYLTMVGNRMNEVMKVLTIIATIFMPLSFIAGVFGMNFDHTSSPWNMPELTWYWGYPFCLGLMAATATLLCLYFLKKGWIGDSSRTVDPTKDASHRAVELGPPHASHTVTDAHRRQRP